MQRRVVVPDLWNPTLLLTLCIALSGCQSRKANSAPSIEFTHIPLAAQGGRERVDAASGRVRNARPKRQIVIHAHSGQRCVQPWTDRPFISIKEDAKWSTETRLAFEYAALLEEPDFHQLLTIDVAPIQSGSVPLARANQRLSPQGGDRSCCRT